MAARFLRKSIRLHSCATLVSLELGVLRQMLGAVLLAAAEPGSVVSSNIRTRLFLSVTLCSGTIFGMGIRPAARSRSRERAVEWQGKRYDGGSRTHAPFSKRDLPDAGARVFLHRRLDNLTLLPGTFFYANSWHWRCQIGARSCRLDCRQHFRDFLPGFYAEPDRPVFA